MKNITFNSGTFFGRGLLKKTRSYNNQLLPRKLTYPLKVHGWKMKCPFEMVGAFFGDMIIFGGGVVIRLDGS